MTTDASSVLVGHLAQEPGDDPGDEGVVERGMREDAPVEERAGQTGERGVEIQIRGKLVPLDGGLERAAQPCFCFRGF
jgi:hypothetical protein